MSFDSNTVDTVWNKAYVASGNNPNMFRKDQCTAWIRRQDYGNRDSIYGWEVDHINPSGGNELSNLRPLHWENNTKKSDGSLSCVVVSSGTRNMRG